MQLLCPHCHNPVEVSTLPLGDVVCTSCGSGFHLEGGSTTGYAPATGKLGRFELLDLVGQGAFGSVYKARDPELDRVVAVKVPRAGNLPGEKDLDRFLREARSVAQLRHPAIVPVHEVGNAEGVPYLVCEFVAGVTLDDRLSGRPLPFRESAELIAVIADALQYAHQHGVVHRDVKPSNVMLDEKGKPHLMDFGLARRDAGEVTMTVEGQLLGTPAYMSPEQARGEGHRVDGRSDVYSLGVVLYRLLTGELPFRGNVRMLLHHVLHDEPRSARSLNDHVPRDLETICQKAMAKEPGKRYGSAGEMAEDLRRYLNGEAIQARPVGRWEKAWRWCRRHPAWAALIAVSSAAVLSVLLGSLYHNARLGEALRKEKEQQERAETNFRKARDAVDRMLTQVGENKALEGIPQWQEHREQFLEDALAFYRGFLKESNDPAVRRETGRAHERVGRIYQMLGKRQQAVDSLEQAIVIQQQLADEFPAETDDDNNLALSYHQLGFLYESSQTMNEAVGPYQKALLIRERLAKSFPGNADFQYNLAITCRHLSFTLAFVGRKLDADATLDKAMKILEALIREHNGESRYQIAFADSCGVKALLLRENAKLDRALDWSTKCIQLLESVLQRERRSTEAKVWLSWRLMERAETLVRLQREDEARKDWKRRADLGEGQSHIDLRIGRAQGLAQLGQHSLATAEVQAMVASGQEPQQASYNFACVYALCSAAARGDTQLSAPERERLGEKYAREAVTCLEKARKRGFFTPDIVEYMKKDSDLDPLESREDYKKLLRELEQEMKRSGK